MSERADALFIVRIELATRLKSELAFAVERLGAGGFSDALLRATKVAAVDTWKSKRILAQRVGRASVRATRAIGALASRVGEFGIASEVERARDAVVSGIKGVGRRSGTAFGNAVRQRREKRFGLVTLIAAWVAFFLTAGGADLQGGAPDLDLIGGPGDHRNVFTHSVLLGLTLEVFLRFCAALVRELLDHMPEDRHPVWSSVARFTEAAKTGGIIGMYLGLSAHLIDDANLLGGATKPYVGVPFPMPMAGHQAAFAGNGVLSAATAVSEIATRTEGA
ncbi:MAG: hypothetical protein FD171_2154 [Actinobacteria bacterium]|nr:MAG: hypothetical protein FD171_2154 [Actinomycetota bacterium]